MLEHLYGVRTSLLMQYHRLRRLQTRAWAPRTLAVISCALALLAAQPALSAQTQAAPQVPLVAPQSSPATITIQPRRETPTSAQPAARRDTTFFSSARRLHILATFEILKRLLISELQPASQQLMVPALALEPLEYLQDLPLTLASTHGQAPPPYAPLPPPERRFLLEHLQLAPPIV